MKTLINHARMLDEGRQWDGALAFDGEVITDVYDHPLDSEEGFGRVIDATGCWVMPGLIDSHVHFREPGLTQKACIESESRAAAAGGVTTFFDMPNTLPQTTTLEALDEKFAIAARQSHVNYSFFFGATSDNAHLFAQLPATRIPGIKLFMGASTGNMLVDGDDALAEVFDKARPFPLMAHCEDTQVINDSMKSHREKYGQDPSIEFHADIRSAVACMKSSLKAMKLATKHHTRLHIAHLSTLPEKIICDHIIKEMKTQNAVADTQPPGPFSARGLYRPITAEACVGHLYFCSDDYARLGSLIKVNPSIKSAANRIGLLQSLRYGAFATVSTDHAPHLLRDKLGGAARAASGMPLIQFSLLMMLELGETYFLVEDIPVWMANNQARLFGVKNRGFLRPGYQADITIVRRNAPWTVTDDVIESRCGWSPMTGHTFNNRVEMTICNGHVVYADGKVDDDYRGQEVAFDHTALHDAQAWHGKPAASGADTATKTDARATRTATGTATGTAQETAGTTEGAAGNGSTETALPLRKVLTYTVGELVPYINWTYYFHAWHIGPHLDEQRREMLSEAYSMLERLDKAYHVHAVCVVDHACSDGDDIILGHHRLPMLRQQEKGEKTDGGGEVFLCLADFLPPRATTADSMAGAFATAVDIGMEKDFRTDDYNQMLVQLLADRLAEAAAERLHEDVRKHYWGYAPDENLSVEELHEERFVGIRPAVGYPSLPDTSLNFILSDILGMKDIGIRLTETGAMMPHASVSGLMLSHPQARYFSLGHIGEDQLADYARRRGLPLELIRRFVR